MNSIADAATPGSRSRSRAPTRGRWVPMAAGMGALLLVYGGWQLFRWPTVDRRLIGDLFFYPVGLAAISAAVGASRRCSGEPRLRSAWRLLALASSLYLAGDIAQTIYELQGPLPFPSAADALYLSFYPLMLWGLLRFPAGRLNISGRLRLGLDLAVVGIGGAMVVTYVVLGPTLSLAGPDAVSTSVSVAYPVGDMILLVGLGSVLLRRTTVASARALQVLVFGLLFFVAADLVYGYVQLPLELPRRGPGRFAVDDRDRIVRGCGSCCPPRHRRPSWPRTGDVEQVGRRTSPSLSALASWSSITVTSAW